MSFSVIPISPVRQSERFESLDVLRGFALLGILIMNITAFAYPTAVYSNPLAYGDFAGANRWVWGLSHVFADQKFLSMFSMLFGAGIALVTEKAERKGVSPWGLHGRRMLWLALIGLVHAYFLWFGDILFTYAVCGLAVCTLRRKSPKTLVTVAIVVFALPSVLGLLTQVSMPSWPERDRAQFEYDWQPPADIIHDEIAVYRSGWWEQMEYRLPMAVSLQGVVLFFYAGWKAAGLMLLGMALYKWKILTGGAATRTYRLMILLGFGLGFPVVVLGALSNLRAGFPVGYTIFARGIPNYWGSAAISLGYIASLSLLIRAKWFSEVKRRLAAVGRMALTNYLLQTVICTTIFYGHGFGLFGQLDRLEQLLVVFGVWIFQLGASPSWLERYRFGPAEWLWRSLTYSQPQPMRQTS